MASLLAAASVCTDLRRAVRRAVRRALVVKRTKLPSRLSLSQLLALLGLFLFILALSSSSSLSLLPRRSALHPSLHHSSASDHQQRVHLLSVLPDSQHHHQYSAQFVPPVAPALPPHLRAHVDAVVNRTSSVHHALTTLYHLPQTVVRCMTYRVAHTLYWKLVLADMIAHPHTHRIYARSRVLFVHTQNGLGNRLRALASGLAMARATARVPVVIWEKDPHLAAPFEEVLNARRNASELQDVLYADLIIMHNFLDWHVTAEQNHTWHGVSYMEKDGRDAEPGILMRFPKPHARHASVQHWIKFAEQHPQLQNGTAELTISEPPPDAPQQHEQPSSDLIHAGKHLYFKSAYVAKTEPESMCSRPVVNRELGLLRPSDAVLQIVQQLDAHALRRAIGVHIRSRSLARDNVDVRTRCEYTRVGARVTDYWRSRSSLKVFVKKMQWAVRRQKSVKFFVASDDVDVVQTLRDKFGNERILHIGRGCDDRLEGCVKYAMADLICLAKTRKIYGSNWSSFSEAAGRLGGKNVYLSGYHFGRLKGFERQWDKFQSGFYWAVDRAMSVWPSWLAFPWNRC